MYQEYWQLSAKPFPYRMSVSEHYPISSQQSALLRLQYCAENSAGCALTLGESGLGKTTVLRLLESQGEHLRPFCHLGFPGLSPLEQLRLICGQLAEAPYIADGPADVLLLDISNSLRRYTAQNMHPVICFDDAQLLSGDVLKDVVLPLLNIRDVDESVDCSVILSGQPVLMSQLSRHPQLRERIAVTARLGGMTSSETSDYIESRLSACEAGAPIFTPDAIRRLHEASQGNPRRLNRLCDMALLVGCADQLKRIDEAQIDSVSTELLRAA